MGAGIKPGPPRFFEVNLDGALYFDGEIKHPLPNVWLGVRMLGSGAFLSVPAGQLRQERPDED